MDFLSTFIIVLLALALAVPGFILRKIKLLPEGTNNVLSVILLYLSAPFLNLSSILGKTFSVEILPGFAAVFILAVVLQLAIYFIAKLCFKRLENDAEKRISVACSFLGNVGFMGIPVMKALFPDNDVLIVYAVVFNVAFNAICWTLALYEITGDKSKMKPWKIILNPPTVAALIAIPFFVLNIKFPENVMNTIAYIGDMTLPLSMLILGIRLADIPFKNLFTSKSVYGAISLKLVISPLLTLGVVLLLRFIIPLDDNVLIALYIIMAMPAAASGLSFAERYGGDTENAAKNLLLGTILCVLTIPLLMLLLQVI